MTIDFTLIPEEHILHFKDGLGTNITRNFTDGTNKIMQGRLNPGCSIGLHRHEQNSETILILSGHARCLYDDREELLSAGQCHYCPQGHKHSLINASPTEPLTYFAIVAEHH